MKRQLPQFTLLIAIALLVGGVSGAMSTSARSQSGAKQTATLSTDQPSTPLGSSFTYNGQLTQGGVPANGQYDFIFTLYDALTGGNQVGGPVTLNNQTVNQGVFIVSLDFGAGAFGGQERWLQLAVRQTGGGAYTTLTPRQAVTAAPYAASLMPGAVITGTLASPVISVTNAIGYGLHGSTSGGSSVAGTYGYSTGSNGIGVKGEANNGNFATGLYGNSSTGIGVWGNAGASSGWGVYGVASGGSNAVGVYGTSSSGNGVYGVSSSNIGVYGTSSSNIGVYGTSSSNIGVSGYSSGNSGVHGYSTSGRGVYGTSTNSSGVFGESISGFGVGGISFNSYGMYGYSSSWAGVVGESDTAGGVVGFSGSGFGVAGESDTSDGVWGHSTSGYAGYFSGNVRITGACCGMAAGSSQIDHPLDPANKLLNHSLVQSPDMKTIYDGVAALDGKGEAWVELPSYFEALNKDFRYQLTCIGGYAPVYVAEQIEDNWFKIAGGRPGLQVSWQVTGIRHDPYAEQHSVQVEAEKPPEERGKYLHPKEWGQPESKGVDYEHNLKVQVKGSLLNQPNEPDVKKDRAPER